MGQATATGPKALVDLVEALGHTSRVVRRHHAAEALIERGAAAVPALVGVLRGGGPGRAVAAYALQRVDSSRLGAAVAALADAAADPNLEVRSDAVWALAQIGPPARAAVPALAAALGEESEPVPSLASPYAVTPANPTLVRTGAAAALAAIGRPVEPIRAGLSQGLSSRDLSVRWWAASSLAAMGTRAHRALPGLAAMARDAEEAWEVRAEACYAIGQVGAPAGEATPLLTALLDDRESWVRVAAARTLARLGRQARGAVPALTAALRDLDGQVRRNAVYALAAIGPAAADAIPALVPLMREENVAGFAAEAVAAIGEAALPALRNALRGNDERLSRLAAHALEVMDIPASRDTLAASDVVPLKPAWSLLWPVHERPVLDAAARRAFAEILAAAQRDPGAVEAWRWPYPKEAFLHYLVEVKQLFLHGSNRDDLEVLRPDRWSTDRNDYGNVAGVYATPDPVTALFFAVVDRDRVWGMSAGYVAERDENGADRGCHVFSIEAESLVRHHWRNGAVYVLPRNTFEHAGEWTSRVPVQPLLTLPVTPDDFPLLHQVWGHELRPVESRFDRGRFFFLWHAQIHPFIPLRDG